MTMEALEEPPVSTASGEVVKSNSNDELISNAEAIVEMDVCHTSNGVADTNDAVDELKHEVETTPIVETTVTDDDQEQVPKVVTDYDAANEAMETEVSSAQADDSVYGNETLDSEVSSEIQEVVSSEIENLDGNIVIETEVVEESVVELDGIVENSGGNITFETEIFIEDNATEFEEETVTNEPDSSNILSEIGQNIELSDVLRSSDVSETVENNNCEQEVFNKEELLDILEGNDVEQSRKVISENFNEDSHKLEEHLAMQQLSRLKSNESRKKKRTSPKKIEKKQPKRNSSSYVSKDTKTKVDSTTASNMLPKESKLKDDEPTSSKISPKESKIKAVEISSSKTALKGANRKVDGGSNNVTKFDETDGSKPAKDAKKKIDEPVSSNSTSQEGKAEAEENNIADISNKDVKIKPEDKSRSQVPKTAKSSEKNKNESIVKALVQDWSDDENMEPDESNTVLHDSEALLESTDDLLKSQENIQEGNTIDESHADIHEDSITSNADVSVTDGETPNNKGPEDSQPQRRLARVIKKKVIYDPDNPDTFTKTKPHTKREKEPQTEKDAVVSTPKKLKTEVPTQVPKSKSPVSKMQWKKPQPKNSKQSGKRLTEIDKLLMDEGAVNMICQLTPEAPKGNKNMKSRAEFIKNIQSNTPDTKEMKFRERKNKIKSEGDPKKLGSDKHRLSLSSSVKSPAVSDDFENHSADDSIIYRRHSSSSYSSSCMSPRRLSDVEGPANPLAHQVSRESQDVLVVGHSELFMEDKIPTPRKDIMNKSDCLSIKEKLNSKLSKALNKRKLPEFKPDKPSKQKKVVEVEITANTDITVKFNQKVAEISINKTGSLFNVQIMKVLENILSHVDTNNDIAVTLITSECGTLCSGIDLKPLLEDVKHAHEIADQARSLMRAMESHKKLLIVGVEGKTQGFSLALSALSDILISSDNASFALSERSNSLIYPCAGVLTSRALPQNILNDLIVFGKELSATEALQGGLVSRLVWPERFQEQVRAIATDIAAQPSENIQLRKQLVSLKKSSCPSTFQLCLEKERDLLVKYWTSAPSMQLLRANLDAA